MLAFFGPLVLAPVGVGLVFWRWSERLAAEESHDGTTCLCHEGQDPARLMTHRVDVNSKMDGQWPSSLVRARHMAEVRVMSATGG